MSHQEELLWEASKTGDIDCAASCIHSGVNINATDDRMHHYGRTALIYAAISGHVDMAKFLISKGADIDILDYRELSAEKYAAARYNTPLIDIINSVKIDIDMMNPDEILRHGEWISCRAYISKIVNIEEKNELGWTLLMKASMFNYPSVVELVLDRGALIDEIEKYGCTALMFSARQGNSDVVKVLLQRGADVNAKNTNGTTALMFAAENGHDQTAHILLSHGADVNILTRENETALMRASIKPYAGAVTDLLISHEAALYVRDEEAVYEAPSLITGDEKRSLLIKAKQDQMRRYHQEMYAHSLLDVCALPHPAGGNIRVFDDILNSYKRPDRPMEILDEEGATTLILASRAGHYDLVGAILNCKLLVVGIDDQDDQGRTALYHACEMGHVSVVKFLLVKKANLDLPSFDGKTPRKVAESPKIIRLLDLQAELLLRQQSHGTKKTIA